MGVLVFKILQKGQGMTPVNRHIIEFWDRKSAFQDLDEPQEYCFKISAWYDSTTPSYARSKIIKINKATPAKTDRA